MLITLFLTAPSLKKHADISLLDGRFIAHRGLHDIPPASCPENSLAAFEEAAKRGYPIENDIHLTADGRVVVFHDDSLKRMCGVDRKPEEMTLAEIKKCRLAATDQTVPTLEECLETVGGRVPLLIEFKATSKKGSYALCAAADKILSDYKGKYLIQSFYPFVLGWYKKNRPDICRGQLSSGFYHDPLSHRLLGCLLFNFIGRPHFISYEYKYKNNIFFRLNRLLGAHPICWTLTSQEALDSVKNQFKSYIFEGFIPR